MKRVIAITALNYFVGGALTLIIPLLLLERNVNVAEIGIVLSVMPLVFLTARLVFAVFADQVGWAHVFVLLNWPGTFFSTLIYFFATSVSAFSVGKIVEGLRESAYWAVNRTAIFSLSPNQKEKEATRINAVIWFSTAVGSAAAGIGTAYLGFSSTLAILIVASATMGVPAGLLWESGAVTPKAKAKAFSSISSLDPRGKGRTFWLVSIALLFFSLATYPLITLLLPVFMQQQLGYSYVSIGLAFLLYNLVAALVTLSTLKKRLGARRVIIQSAIGLFATFLLAEFRLLFPRVVPCLSCHTRARNRLLRVDNRKSHKKQSDSFSRHWPAPRADEICRVCFGVNCGICCSIFWIRTSICHFRYLFRGFLSVLSVCLKNQVENIRMRWNCWAHFILSDQKLVFRLS